MNILALAETYSCTFQPLAEFGDVTVFYERGIPKEMIEDCDVLAINGHSDVDPWLYGEEIYHPLTNVNQENDYFVMEAVAYAQGLGKPLIGIGKGAQQLCVAAGGELYQHCDNHLGQHFVTTPTGSLVNVMGSHHQMMKPVDADVEWLAWADISDIAETGAEVNRKHKTLFREPEMLIFKDIKGLACQYHPEWMSPETLGNKYFKQCVKEFLDE